MNGGFRVLVQTCSRSGNQYEKCSECDIDNLP